MTRLAFEVHRAADFLNVGTDNIHPHTTAGELGDLVASRKPWQENQVEPLAFAQSIGVSLCYQFRANRFVNDPRRIDPRSIVGDLDDDLSTFVKCPQRQPALGRFAIDYA